MRLAPLLHLLVLACACQTNPSFAQTAPNKPQTNLPSPSSDVLDLTPYKGKLVYLDFWASWCGPCKQSFPWMNAMQTKYSVQGLVVVAVNLDQDPQKASQFLAQNTPAFTIKYDPKGKLAEFYQVKTMPTSFLLDRNGQVISKHAGFHLNDLSSYETELTHALSHLNEKSN